MRGKANMSVTNVLTCARLAFTLLLSSQTNASVFSQHNLRLQTVSASLEKSNRVCTVSGVIVYIVDSQLIYFDLCGFELLKLILSLRCSK